MEFIIACLQLLHGLLMHSLQFLVGTFCGVQISILGLKLVSSSLFQVYGLLFEVADIVVSILHLSLFLSQVTA